MANKVYQSETLQLIDGSSIYAIPLKIKYLREFMDYFKNVKNAKDDEDAMDRLIKCVAIAMRQYDPQRATVADVEDLFDIHLMYKILDISADIKINDNSEKTVQENIKEAAKSISKSWKWNVTGGRSKG